MPDFLFAVARFGLRFLLLLLGAFLLLGLLLVIATHVAGWGLRALWAKLTGRVVQPWTAPVRMRGMWAQVYRHREPDVAHPQRRHSGGVLASVTADVTDVQVREVRKG